MELSNTTSTEDGLYVAWVSWFDDVVKVALDEKKTMLFDRVEIELPAN